MALALVLYCVYMIRERHVILKAALHSGLYIYIKMNKEVRMLLPKKDLIQVEWGKLIIIMRISIYSATTHVLPKMNF